jgi:hypothetical protein
MLEAEDDQEKEKEEWDFMEFVVPENHPNN